MSRGGSLSFIHRFRHHWLSSVWHPQTLLLALGYGVAVTILSSTITGTIGVIAAGIGAVTGVLGVHWQIGQSLRPIVATFIGLGLITFGLVFPQWIGHWWIAPYALGISATLVMVQALTLATIAAGCVMVVRSLAQTARAFSIFDGLAITGAICLRFTAHRNYNWSNPRFLADWVGIQGYELPAIFALLGLAALLIGLTAGMRTNSCRHAAASIFSIVLLFTLLLAIGGKLLKNPPPELIASSSSPGDGAPTSGAPIDDAAGSESNDAAGSESNDAAGSEPNDKAGSEPNGGGSSGSSGDNSDKSGSASSESTTKQQQGSSASSAAANNDPLPSAESARNTPQPIALVLLEEDIEPYEKIWYFRQTAVSLFNGKRLVTASDDLYDTDIPSAFSHREVLIEGIPLPDGMHKIVPVVVNLIADQPRPFGLPSMISFATIRNPDTDYFRQSYRATSAVLTNPIVDDELYDLYATLCHHYSAGDSQWSDDQRTHYTRAPRDPRFKELAEQIISERMSSSISAELRDSPMLKALSIKRWLEQNTTYSLNPKFDDASVNPAEQFLFGERHGYCVHIAHASVYLLRALGIPSRIGVGYMVPTERNGKSSSILIQSTDAHAWPEIYLEDAGWIIVDASPERIDESTQMAPEPDPTVSQFLGDKARNKDQHQQQLRDATEYSRGISLRLGHIPWALLAGILFLYGVKIWILLSPQFANENDIIRVTQRATILQLSESGIQRRFGETRTEFGQRLAATYPEFAQLSQFHVRDTYGLRQQLARVACLDIQSRTAERIRQTTGFFRRTIGRLDPRFWTLVR